jgi:hypothetical protein
LPFGFPQKSKTAIQKDDSSAKQLTYGPHYSGGIPSHNHNGEIGFWVAQKLATLTRTALLTGG